MYVCIVFICLFGMFVLLHHMSEWIAMKFIYLFLFMYLFVFPRSSSTIIILFKKCIFELEVKHLTFHIHEINFYKRVKYNNTKLSKWIYQYYRSHYAT